MVEATYDAQQNPNTSKLKGMARQPSIFDYAQNSQFRVSFPNYPKIEYFCTAIAIPGISLTAVDRPTSLANIPMVGDTITYENFEMTFMVDENLENYREIYDWMINIGFPDSHSQFRNLDRREQGGGPGRGKGDRELYDDIMITILSSKNNPVVRVRLYEAWPVTLGGLEYTQSGTDVEYLTCSVSWAYMYYDFKSV
jgi:hypothetical protein